MSRVTCEPRIAPPERGTAHSWTPPFRWLPVVVSSLLAPTLLGCSEDDSDDSSDQTQPVAPGSPCPTAGAMAPANDGCNTCVCENDVWACTERACQDQPCEDGATMPADDGCNTCTCSDGEWQCTLLGCLECPPPVDSAEACATVVVYAKDPASGMCCEYGSPCTAPGGWEQFYSNAECEAGMSGSLSWFTTCGDPVCGPDNRPTGETACTAEQTEGSSCSDEGTRCDPGAGCGQNLVCAGSDPKLAPGGCPISRRRFKRDITYVAADERALLSQMLLETPLATWRYKNGDERRRLGFILEDVILEDVEPNPSVDAARDRVDLYGYTTMAVAALQEQAQQIAQLQVEIEALRVELADTKRSCGP